MQPCRPGCDGAEREGEESAVCRFEMVSSGIPCRIACAGFVVDKYRCTTDGETWFAEIPTYSPGFSVGVIGDMYLNPYFNLRFIPTVHFGDKKFVFREQVTGEEFTTSVRSTILSFPLSVKFSALRLNNYRPYLIGGVYGAMDLGRKKGMPVLLKAADFGLEFGIGCDIYLPFFKLCPELKFSFGLVDLLQKDRSDLTDKDLIKYPNALSKATSRMVSLTFNFE